MQKSISILSLIALFVCISCTSIRTDDEGSIDSKNKSEDPYSSEVKDKIKTAGSYINIMQVPLMTYRVHTGEYPSTDEGLNALYTPPISKESNWRGPYIKEVRKDPWGNEYIYRNPSIHNSKGYDIISMGPDGEISADDIQN